MPWLKFSKKFTWHISPAVSQVFKPDGGRFRDGRYAVTRACAEKAAAKGAAEETPTPKRSG
jgi:hypothetical protein